jgi:hypothetical protein
LVSPLLGGTRDRRLVAGSDRRFLAPLLVGLASHKNPL